MTKTLAEREAEYIAALKPDTEAKRLAPKLREMATEARTRAWNSKVYAEADLAELEAFRLERAAELLLILETEQYRQRESIKLYLAGREGRDFLKQAAETWNNDR